MGKTFVSCLAWCVLYRLYRGLRLQWQPFVPGNYRAWHQQIQQLQLISFPPPPLFIGMRCKLKREQMIPICSLMMFVYLLARQADPLFLQLHSYICIYSIRGRPLRKVVIVNFWPCIVVHWFNGSVSRYSTYIFQDSKPDKCAKIFCYSVSSRYLNSWVWLWSQTP